MKGVSGRYTNGKNASYYIYESPNEFQYFLRSEMGVLQYSKGKWILDDDKLYLEGFTSSDLKSLQYTTTIADNKKENVSKFEIRFRSDSEPITSNTIVTINNRQSFNITKDTVLHVDAIVRSMLVKSFQSSIGLQSSYPQIDTLYTGEIIGPDKKFEYKSIVLELNIKPYDFNRVRFLDTLNLRKRRHLYRNSLRLERIK